MHLWLRATPCRRLLYTDGLQIQQYLAAISRIPCQGIELENVLRGHSFMRRKAGMQEAWQGCKGDRACMALHTCARMGY